MRLWMRAGMASDDTGSVAGDGAGSGRIAAWLRAGDADSGMIPKLLKRGSKREGLPEAPHSYRTRLLLWPRQHSGPSDFGLR